MCQICVLLCEDKPDHLALRERTLPAHMLYVARQKGVDVLHRGVALDYEIGSANRTVSFGFADDLECVGDLVVRDSFTTAGLYAEDKTIRLEGLMHLPRVRGLGGEDGSRMEGSRRNLGEPEQSAPCNELGTEQFAIECSAHQTPVERATLPDRPEGRQKSVRAFRVAKAARVRLEFACRQVVNFGAVVRSSFRFDEHVLAALTNTCLLD